MDANSLRIELIQKICRLPEDQLPQAAAALNQLSSPVPAFADPKSQAFAKDWPHAPLHRLSENGTYMVTTGTYRKAHVFRDPTRLTLLENTLLSLATKYGWQLEAWAVFSNHYHFVGHTLSSPSRLKEFLTELHANTAREVNQLDGISDRQVWHNYWDKQLTFEKSYLARLNYVHQNAVKHGLVSVANRYRWCSAAWFERTARPAQIKTIYSFKTDSLKVADNLSRWRSFELGVRRVLVAFGGQAEKSESGDQSPHSKNPKAATSRRSPNEHQQPQAPLATELRGPMADGDRIPRQRAAVGRGE